MGFFGCWLIVKGGTEEGLRKLGVEPAGEGPTPGWTFAGAGRDLPKDLVGLVARSSADGGAALGAYVFDSDWGYVAAARDGQPVAELLLNPESARSEGMAKESDVDSFSRWSEAAPQQVSPAEVRDVVEQEWVFAEEGVQELFERLGLPGAYDPLTSGELRPNAVIGELPPRLPPPTMETIGAGGLGDYEGPFGWMGESTRIGDQRVAWRDARFIPGVGADFLGIWDRERPTRPIARFSRTSRGEARLVEALRTMQAPELRRILALDSLGGLVLPLELGAEMSVAERSLSIREARFVAGRGEGFVGVWDRDNPGEPIERFPDTWSGEITADQRALELLFEFETSQKRLNGVRIFLPRVESRRLPWRAGLVGGRSGSRLRRFLEVHLPSSSHIITPTGPWILTEEEEDPRWSPRIPRGPGGR